MNKIENNVPQVLQELQVLEKSKDWKKAEGLLEKHKEEFDAGVYYYNLGIIKFKEKDFVSSRIALEMAQKNAFESILLDDALEEVKENLSAYAIENISPWGKVEINFIELPVQLYLSITVMILISFLLLKNKLESVVTKVFWILFAFLPLLFKLFLFPEVETIVTKADVPIYLGPSKVFEKVSELPPGIKIYVKKEEANNKKWLNVLYPKSLQGWMEYRAENLEFIHEEI